MAVSDSRRLHMVLAHLYPDLRVTIDTDSTGDYHLINHSDGNGTQLIWNNVEISEPTAQQLSDAKEAATDAYWWEWLRKIRNKLLTESDWSQGADVPSALKSSYATYRTDLRNLPTTVSKPSFSTLNTTLMADWNIEALMPTKP